MNTAPDNCAVHAILGSHNALSTGVIEFFNKRVRDGQYPDGRVFQSVTYELAATTPQLQVADLYAYLVGRGLSGAPMDERELRAIDSLRAKPGGVQIVDAATFAGEWAVFEQEVNDKLEQRGIRPRWGA